MEMIWGIVGITMVVYYVSWSIYTMGKVDCSTTHDLPIRMILRKKIEVATMLTRVMTERARVNDSHIHNMLSEKIKNELLEKGYIQFMKDNDTMPTGTLFKARIFVTSKGE